MFCKKCGAEISRRTRVCPDCGLEIGARLETCFNSQKQGESCGKSIVALVLGVVGLLAWIIPFLGLTIGIAGLVMGIIGMKKSGKGMALAGIVLAILCLVLTVVNARIGTYYGTAWFQKQFLEEDTKENDFCLKDMDGNVLMVGGIKSAEVKLVQQSDGESAVVEITFTKEAANQFAEITKDCIGQQVGIYLNENEIASPYVQSSITTGVCQILIESLDEAEKMAEQLNNTK